MKEATMAENYPVLIFTDNNFEDEVRKHNGLVLVDFWAAWCAPCRAIAPHIADVAEKYSGKVKVGKLNVDEEPTTAGNLGIRALPTLLLFKDGQVIEQLVGAVARDKIEALIDSNM